MFENKKKLQLNKETIRALSGAEMKGVAGGRAVFSGASHGCTCTCNCQTLVCDLNGGGGKAMLRAI